MTYLNIEPKPYLGSFFVSSLGYSNYGLDRLNILMDGDVTSDTVLDQGYGSGLEKVRIRIRSEHEDSNPLYF